ncbi:hypothetical protein [Nostoc sp. MS1]|nr:hypothetical protein [Nostoc sp. MS1]
MNICTVKSDTDLYKLTLVEFIEILAMQFDLYQNIPNIEAH